MPWESLTFELSERLTVNVEFEVESNGVREFEVTLRRMNDDESVQWLVRFETHGGRPHKHERWSNAKDPHGHPKGWHGNRAELVVQAIEDIEDRAKEYEARYLAWMRKHETG